MMPFDAILSTSDTVFERAALAASRSLASSAARMAFRAVRSVDRIWRLCSRRLTFCLFAFRADLVRLATALWSSLYGSESGRQRVDSNMGDRPQATGDGQNTQTVDPLVTVSRLR